MSEKEPIAEGYAEALDELEAILVELEDGEVDVDQLAARVRRAGELVRFCQGRLDHARVEVTRLVAELDPALEPDSTESAAGSS